MKKKMTFWHLFPIEHESFIKKYPQNQTWSAVVAAKTEKKARKVAAETGGVAWLDKTETHCAELIAKEFDVAAIISDEPPWGFHATPWKKCKHAEKFGLNESLEKIAPRVVGDYVPLPPQNENERVNEELTEMIERRDELNKEIEALSQLERLTR